MTEHKSEENVDKTLRIKNLSLKALKHFQESDTHNIFEDGEDELKIVKLYNDQSPVYFLVSQKLGAGAFGEVSLGTQLDINNGTTIGNSDVAIKITDFTEGGTVSTRDIESGKAETEHENKVLSKIQQSQGFSIGTRKKNIKTILDIESNLSWEREAQIQEAIVAMPLYPGKDMQHKKHKDKFSYGSMTFAESASTLCKNLANLHDNGIIHTDLKPANIIWDPEKGQANIVDFNRAKFIDPEKTYVFSNASSDKDYMAPECLTKGNYRFSQASDVFSLGKILKEKFDISMKNSQKESLSNQKHLSYDQLIIQPFLDRMTNPDESQRPTIKECTEFFNQIENKMKLDIIQPDNKLRITLSKKIISLEVYASQLRNEIKKQSKFDTFLSSKEITTDKAKKYEEVIKTIELLTRALSTPAIDTELLKSEQQSSAKTNKFFSFKDRFQQIVDEVNESINKDDQQFKI